MNSRMVSQPKQTSYFLVPEIEVEYNKRYTEVSLFGMQSASTDDGGNRPLNDTTQYADDPVSFQVYAIKEDNESKNVYFKLTSSTLCPAGADAGLGTFPALSSSYIL